VARMLQQWETGTWLVRIIVSGTRG
jgi:hypothetical protein